MRLHRTWGGRFALAFFVIGLLGGSKIIFWSLSVLAALLTILGHKWFVEKIRNKYGDDLFSLSAREIPEVQTYFSTLSKKEIAEDNAYIKEMIQRRGH
jgi:hypothetical protein